MSGSDGASSVSPLTIEEDASLLVGRLGLHPLPCFMGPGHPVMKACMDEIRAAVEAEREACAKLAEKFRPPSPSNAGYLMDQAEWSRAWHTANQVAQAIRARGQEASK